MASSADVKPSATEPSIDDGNYKVVNDSTSSDLKDDAQSEFKEAIALPSDASTGASDLSFQKDYRFWMIMLTLCFAMLLTSLEATIVITSLPTIVHELGLKSNYIWVTNVFFLASAAVQPLFGQVSNLFGRKSVLIFVFAAYTLGSGIAGGANEEIMLIVGRTIQGIGSGGLNMASEVIISDLVPLRLRGNYIAMLLLVASVGFAIGPFVGGAIVENTTWRWVFYLNLPIGFIGIAATYFFLNLKWDHQEGIRSKLNRIDYTGNFILIASTVSVLIALTWAGPIYDWSDARILSPLLLGLAGLFLFSWYEASGIPKEPVMPLRLFPNRTSRIIYLNTFLNSLLLFWCFFFFPLYFQAVQLSSPSRSGIQMLPVTLIALPGAAFSAWMLSRWGKYKMLHLTGFVLLTGGIALLAVLKRDSSMAAWVLIQIPPSIGSGFLISTLLPAFQASLAEADQAAATGTWCFIRTLGQVWGIAIAGTIFNFYAKDFSHLIDDPIARHALGNGDAYASATRYFVMQFPEPVQRQIRDVFLLALRRVFLISIAFGGAAFLFALFEKDIPLRKSLDTEYGMKERENQNDQTA